MRFVLCASLLAITACSSWHVKYPGELAPEPGDDPQRGFVATSTEAYELDVIGRAAGELHGIVRRHWQVGLDRDAERAESPDDTVERLGWPRTAEATGTHIAIPMHTIRQARLYETDEKRTATALMAGVTGVMLGLVGLIIVGGLTSGSSGRPLRVRGKQQFAPVAATRGWSAEPVAVTAVPDAVRTQLAAVWTAEAQAEHSSIAAFAKLSLELIALGAPPALLSRTHRAALDEVEHARLCFALASAYAGAHVGPGGLPSATTGEPANLERLARETLLDGCIGETVAAETARLAALTATDPAVTLVLCAQATDEAEHAALAWDIVDWCLAVCGEPLRATLLAALVDVHVPRGPHLPTHGRLGSEVTASLVASAVSAARRRLAHSTSMKMHSPGQFSAAAITLS